MAEWRVVSENHNYLISDEGQVFSFYTNKILKPHINHRGYYSVCLGRNNRRYIHKLVAEAFIPNPNNYPQINHIDENKSNNNISNLEWCDVSYNVNYGTRNQRAKQKVGRPIAQYNMNGELVNTFISVTEASKIVDISRQSLINNLQGRTKSTKGYIFKYL